ncbi:MAG: NAD(P)-dependent dehydrogenase (short-subunit alcohol dehydrogenase family) [Myxococcota bacterium]|jgi:NAD(P)-dependent dehydrogenase (short-subunit alcohol dehydrogenase family)
MKNLHGKVAVITGAASGLGRGLAEVLAAEGCRLALVDVHAERLAEVAAEHPGCSTHLVDVSDREAMAALPEAVLEAHGAVHLVINNAGVTITASFLDHTMEDLDWLLGINLWGVIYGCRAFLPHLLAGGEGHIVNISSLFGIIGVPGQTSYCTAKFAVRGLSESLAEELAMASADVGITVVHPGAINTRIIKSARTGGEDLDRAVRFFERHGMSPHTAARQIVAAVKRGKQRVLITREAWWLDLLKRIFPTWGNRLATRGMMKTMGMSGVVKDAARR